MFKSMSIGGNTFTKDKQQYEDINIKHQKNQKKFSNPNQVNHEAKFKLAVKGHGDPIGKFPEFIPPRQRAVTESSEPTKSKKDNSEEKREDWKPTSGNLTRPTPSISLMNKNIRRYL